MIFFTSDLHLGHTNIIGFTGRPYVREAKNGEQYPDTDWMAQDIVRRWNDRVGHGDVVYVLGDVCMGHIADTLPICERLNGFKVLVPGNHDRMFEAQGEKYRIWADKYQAVGFSIMDVEWEEGRYGTLELPVLGHVAVSHFPYVQDERHQERYIPHHPVDDGLNLLHGHTHGIWRKRTHMVGGFPKSYMIDVGVDSWGGYPVSLGQLIAALNTEGDLEPIPWTLL